MRPKLLILLVVSAVTPVAALAALGFKVVRDEQRLVREKIDRLLAARLDDIAATASRFVREQERLLQAAMRLDTLEPALLRERARGTPLVRHFVVRNADGSLDYPRTDGSLTESERAFLRRTEQLWTKADSLRLPTEQSSARPVAGWYAWYWQNGLNLIYWRQARDGRTIGAEVDRVRLLADLIARLPDSQTLGDARVRLVDARGRPAHQWGRYEPEASEVPRVERALTPPLQAWRVQYFVSPSAASASGRGTAVAMILGLVAVGVALCLSAVFVYRESTRAVHEATERVTFVNQVSHELKTPLTNIRMYAELLAREVEDVSPKAVRHLGIIVSESQRLSRLIGNVLTFARQRRDALRLHPTSGCVDDVIQDVLAQHGPSLEQHGLVVTFSRGAPGRVELDTDALAQIAGNVISNAEKYAAAGKRLDIASSQAGDETTVLFSDCGPGIPASKAEEVFRPFARLTSAVTEGVSGAGIGLSLARDLARLHGGDLVLTPSERGTRMTLTLKATQVRS